MIIDCDRCVVRGNACRDCVVGVFLGLPGSAGDGIDQSDLPSGARSVQLDAPEARALNVLAEQGLVPRLRLVSVEPRRVSPTTPDEDDYSDVG
ncbi:MAG: hypothetical protein QOC67_711 [Pseudonocardiales bacterium]|jgi:hypothetical protein|nr:hypothetical protein [Pseudonocardia sp.]MDT7589754.1 hypothetical protein [Pseudonocardiales bacterium]MDT7590791.1 hypothetical protein [Pseudonocardiales bacterium]MDT7624601.1 hypothetical protein [Pseudonocardiales bacterium]MDT7752719.1 hypothetical protein [Pseudonocardiales bacterium]